MVDAAELVAMLLLSRHDYLPGLRTATGSLRALPGPAESRYVPCEQCDGVGRKRGIQTCIVCRDRKAAGKTARVRHGCLPCLACDGRGERRRRKSDEAWDAYAGKPLAELENEIRDAWLASRQGKRLVLADGESSNGGYHWERERERYRTAGSYDELDRQLRWLAATHPGRHGQLEHWAAHQHDCAFTWTPLAILEVKGTLEMLGERMAKPIRVPRWVQLSHQRIAA